jgi:hypothetical protein
MTFHADKNPQSAREGVNIASSMTLKQPLVCTGGATNLPATKEDLRNGLFNDADLKEWVSILKHRVLGNVMPLCRETQRTSILNMGWRKTWKLLEKTKEGEEARRKPKSRLYCKGFQDNRKELKALL